MTYVKRSEETIVSQLRSPPTNVRNNVRRPGRDETPRSPENPWPSYRHTLALSSLLRAQGTSSGRHLGRIGDFEEPRPTIRRFSDDVCSKEKSYCTYGARSSLPALRGLGDEVCCRRSVVNNEKSYANRENCDADDDFGRSVFEFEQLKDVVITVISSCGPREKKATAGPATV
ncbi:unnamed protein product [Macrosiphum euphorbiae]|uniref:Uncharacterized protein n=1 Tax=Macrosiphum euphorbiae TaxID=13131 RepID=A0AAV0VPR1_9HEMI|nr:unnamed protein product [Macrosiphum euphorbiae]